MVTFHRMPDLTDAILLVILCKTGRSQSAMLTWLQMCRQHVRHITCSIFSPKSADTSIRCCDR